jgi:PAS domain S-box-containing protein
MDKENKEKDKLKRRIAGLEKTLQIVTGYSGRIEKNLRQLFEVVSDTMPVPMMISLKTGSILFFNGNAQKIFGYSEKEFHNITASLLYEDPDNRGIFLKTLEDKGEVRDFAVSLKKADGSFFPASLFSRQIVFEGQNCLLTVIHDLSELKQEEEKRLMLERQLRQTQKMEAIGTMAGGIAHDFNNILTVIFGKLELTGMMLPEGSKAAGYIADALTAARRAKAMTKQILAFCRKTEYARKACHISTVVAEAYKMIASLTPSDIEVRLGIKAESAIILCDPTQIHQVMMNLCSNAHHALRDRGGVIEILLEEVRVDSQEKIMIPALKSGDYVRLTVRDNGPGMEKSIIDRVFDPFFTTKPSGEGTGMGLSIVHGILQAHGGAVSVESEPGKGAAFHCYFPLVAQTEELIESVMLQKTIQGGTEKILFVDDENDILSTYSQLLKNLGYRVTTRSGSREALELFNENPDMFDLVITDDTMPEMSGRAMASEMLKIRYDIPIIMITGRETDDKAISGIGIKVLIRKPFSQNKIGSAIRKILDKNREIEND